MKVVTVKFGRSKREWGCHKVRFSLRDWFSCDEQKDRQKVAVNHKFNLIAICFIYPIFMSLFCLSHSFVYLLYFCPSVKARTDVK